MAERTRDEEREQVRTTIRDIACLSGVSVATVSRVLNGRPDVAPTTRETVLRLVREQGYTINRSARSLVDRCTDLVAVTVPAVQEEYFARILAGAAETLYQQDVRFVLCPTRHEHDREVSLLHRLMQGTTDGAMLILPEETEVELLELQRRNYPFVVVGPRIPLPDHIPVISSANMSGARAAVGHLVELGHRRIAAITGPRKWSATLDRLEGYRASLLASGIPVREKLIVEGDFQVNNGYEAGRQLLSGSNPPTAIFAFNDLIAFGVMQAARERNIQVPEDLSIVGFDDIRATAFVHPALTTVRQPTEEMGRVAASLLHRLLSKQPAESLRLELATRLLIRGTTAPPSRVAT